MIKIVRRPSMRAVWVGIQTAHALFDAGYKRVSCYGLNDTKRWKKWVDDGDKLRNQLHGNVRWVMRGYADLPNWNRRMAIFRWKPYQIGCGGICPGLMKFKEFREYILRGLNAKNKPIKIHIRRTA